MKKAAHLGVRTPASSNLSISFLRQHWHSLKPDEKGNPRSPLPWCCMKNSNSRSSDAEWVRFVGQAKHDLSEICCLCGHFINSGKWFVRSRRRIAHYGCARVKGWDRFGKKLKNNKNGAARKFSQIDTTPRVRVFPPSAKCLCGQIREADEFGVIHMHKLRERNWCSGRKLEGRLKRHSATDERQRAVRITPRLYKSTT